MSDRTYMQLTILECTRKDAAQVLALLKEAGFADESDKVLTLGRQYTLEEARIGTLVYELAYELAPLCSFAGWEDPKYEYSGTHVSSIMKPTGPSEIVVNNCLQDGTIIVTAIEALDAAHKGELGKLLNQEHYELLETVYEKAINSPQETPTIVIPYTYLIIERQHSPSLAVRYPDNDTAQWALKSSFFINSLYQENCLDAYMSDHVDQALRDSPLGLEEVVPPGDDSAIDNSAVPASLADWETEGVDSV